MSKEITLEDLYSLMVEIKELLVAGKPVVRIKKKVVPPPALDTMDLIARVVQYLNRKCKTNFRPKTKSTMSLINGRCSEGYEWADFKKVIDVKYADWYDNEKMARYLSPDTLFRPSNFEKYLNQKGVGDKSRNEFKYYKLDQNNNKIYKDEDPELYESMEGSPCC